MGVSSVAGAGSNVNVQHESVLLDGVASVTVIINQVKQAKTIILRNGFRSSKATNEITIDLISNTEVVVTQKKEMSVTTVSFQVIESS